MLHYAVHESMKTNHLQVLPKLCQHSVFSLGNAQVNVSPIMIWVKVVFKKQIMGVLIHWKLGNNQQQLVLPLIMM